MAEAPTLVFELNDGTKVETTFSAPYSMREQVDFEEHFRISFIAMEAAAQEMNAVQTEGRAGDPAVMPRIQWIMWFGWYRARPKVASTFRSFLDQLSGYDIESSDDEPEGEPDAADAVDPTGPEDRSDQGR